MNRSRIATIVVAALAVVAIVVAVVWWQDHDAEARSSGSCQGATYSLETESEDGTLEVSFELQSGEPGQEWEVTIEQGDTVLLEGTRTTDEDAEIDADAYADPDADGDITATATREGQTCSASVSR